MASVVVGSIPEKVSYIFADETSVSVGCFNWYDSSDKPQTIKENVLPTFPIDASDSKMLTKAKDWATNYNYRKSKSKSDAQVVTQDNTPITNVRVLSLEHRGQGGRAYKAVIDKYYVDLREDVLMDVLLKAGVKENGFLQGEYVWAKLGSQMKLIRIGSELHRLIVEFDSKKDIKPVKKNELEIGGVYQNRKKDKAIFLGYVNTTLYKLPPLPAGKNRYNTGYKATFEYLKSEVKKSMLFYTYYDYTGLEKSLKEMKKPDGYFYNFKILKSHKYIEKINQVDLEINMVDKLRESALNEIKGKILEYSGHKAPRNNYTNINGYHLEESVSRLSEYTNIYQFDSDPIEPFEVKKYLLFT